MKRFYAVVSAAYVAILVVAIFIPGMTVLHRLHIGALSAVAAVGFGWISLSWDRTTS